MTRESTTCESARTEFGNTSSWMITFLMISRNKILFSQLKNQKTS